MLKRFFEALKVLVGRETLEDAPRPSKVPRPSFLSWLLQPEKLPAPAVSVPPRRTSLWRWLLMPEELQPAGEGGKVSTGKPLLTTLLAREILPRDPVPEKRSRPRPWQRPWGKRGKNRSTYDRGK